MAGKFPYSYAVENRKAFIEFAAKDSPIHNFAGEADDKALGGIGVHRNYR